MKQVIVKVHKVANDRYEIRQRRRFLWWHFYQKGCPRLKLPRFFPSFNEAHSAVTQRGKKMNVKVVIVQV